MKALLTLTGVLAAIAVAAPAALADPFITDTLGGNGHAVPSYRIITDTLGGNGHAKAGVQGYRFVTDTLGGNGHAKAGVQGYRFITDTLAPGGGRVSAAPSPRGFSWRDATIGAGSVAGALIMLGAALFAVRRREPLAV